VTSRRLPEVGEGHWLRHAGPLGTFARDLSKQLVGYLLATVELGPEGRVVLVLSGKLREPAIEEWGRRNEQHRALPLLAVDGDLVAVFGVGDIAHSEFLAVTRPGT